jgi:mannose-6-phosphate isomerase-like protein (cupin superfamily)
MTIAPTLLTVATDLRTSTTAQRFDGHTHGGGVDVSFFLNHTAPGGGASEHRHPYPEVFVLLCGEATFMVGGVQVAAQAGQVLVVPAQATHSFRNSGTGSLEMISIHPAAEMVTEWADEACPRTSSKTSSP